MNATTESSDKENIKISFVKSNKGQSLLLLNDYLYKCNKKTNTKKYWQCISNGCTVYLHTDTNDKYLGGDVPEHDHESNPELVEVRQVRQKIKERALQEIIPISIIYEQETSKASISSTTLAILPTSHEIYPSVAKARQKVVPLLPNCCSFDIPDDYKHAIDGNRFLLADELLARRERLLIFASDHQLDLLFQSPVIYMDGTFSKSPPHFMQVYIIHAVLFDICVPCVFCLLVNKKALTYRHIFLELKEKAKERGKVFSPITIMSDFESGVIPVLKSEFPSSKHYGCFFHFCQAVYRQIQHLGKQKDYSSNESFRLLCRKLMALALMPYEQVINSFNEIQADADLLPDHPMEELLLYFEKNWLNIIDLWNVSARDSRTNNVCEGEMTNKVSNISFFFKVTTTE
ncbi:unnamed protein product [Rotaria socialis]|uniref:MULE transposase domain-containing protein n=1 Tax=Rotaria socialis TaxID=392032 RepID=A0A818QMY7_9BILA|nr:unnamed protein product [Rotaria socialis]CAF3511235.1 unnamed protein product [Rotaria socialis]CAF3641194.1 unnamed protein product [Rotaria socialis]